MTKADIVNEISRTTGIEKAAVQTTVEAFMEKSYTKALQALTLNRTVISPVKAKMVLDDLMSVSKDFWVLEK